MFVVRYMSHVFIIFSVPPHKINYIIRKQSIINIIIINITQYTKESVMNIHYSIMNICNIAAN